MTVNSYCTVAEVAASLPDLPSLSANYTTLITRLIPAASRAIDKFTKRDVGAYYVDTDVTLFFGGGNRRSGNYPYDYGVSAGISGIDLRIEEIATDPTSIYVSLTGSLDPAKYTLLATTDYIMGPDNALSQGKPYNLVTVDVLNGNHAYFPTYRRAIKITGKFGYSLTVPDAIKQTCIMQVGRWFNRAKQAYQGSHSVTQGDQTISHVDKLDTDLEKLLRSYTRVTI